MIAVINDISFQYPYGTIELAMFSMHKFLDICRRIETDEITNIDEIKTGVIDTQMYVCSNYKLIQLVQDFRDREERTLLLSILTNRGAWIEKEIF